MAKPLANGFPIGAVMMRDSVAETMTAGVNHSVFLYFNYTDVLRFLMFKAHTVLLLVDHLSLVH